MNATELGMKISGGDTAKMLQTRIILSALCLLPSAFLLKFSIIFR
jgi:hypothetical protein